VTEVLQISTALAQRSVTGGTSPEALQEQLAEARALLSS